MKTAVYVAAALLTIAALVLGYRAYTDEEMAAPNDEPAAVDSAPGGDSASPDRPPVPADVRAHIEEHADLVRLASPAPYQVIESPLEITGRARGPWYFEASFPVVLVNWDGLIIAEGYVTAEGDWMTEDFVPFSGTLEFEAPDFDERGTLILQKHNASSRRELDDALEVPVRFEIE
ncbi:MAG: Gmad2 immunoglobulin-like domain-containing protein [Gemmatimonadota bacterium]